MGKGRANLEPVKVLVPSQTWGMTSRTPSCLWAQVETQGTRPPGRPLSPQHSLLPLCASPPLLMLLSSPPAPLPLRTPPPPRTPYVHPECPIFTSLPNMLFSCSSHVEVPVFLRKLTLRCCCRWQFLRRNRSRANPVLPLSLPLQFGLLSWVLYYGRFFIPFPLHYWPPCVHVFRVARGFLMRIFKVPAPTFR